MPCLFIQHALGGSHIYKKLLKTSLFCHGSSGFPAIKKKKRSLSHKHYFHTKYNKHILWERFSLLSRTLQLSGFIVVRCLSKSTFLVSLCTAHLSVLSKLCWGATLRYCMYSFLWQLHGHSGKDFKHKHTSFHILVRTSTWLYVFPSHLP